MPQGWQTYWWPLLGLGGAMAPVIFVGAAIASGAISLPPSPMEEEKKALLRQQLPSWFPDWLYKESTVKDLKEYYDLIYWAGVIGKDDLQKIPEMVYHVTANPDEIMRTGFKTATELGVRGFGGTGDYVSVTTLDNAKIYLENMREACKILNGMVNLRQLRDWIIKQASGRQQVFDEAFNLARGQYRLYHPGEPERSDLDYYIFNTPDFLWEVFSKAFITNGPQFALFIGKPSLLHKSPDQIKIIEARPSPRLRFRHSYNIFRHVDMSGRYTYNKLEREWRVWDARDLRPTRIMEDP